MLFQNCISTPQHHQTRILEIVSVQALEISDAPDRCWKVSSITRSYFGAC